MSLILDTVNVDLGFTDRSGQGLASFKRNLNGLGAMTSDAGARMSGLGHSITGIGVAASRIAVPLIAAAAASVKFSTDMSRGMANVATLIPGNTARVNELKKGIQDLAIKTGQSTSDLTGGLYQVISAFGDTNDTLAILNVNARAARGGLATTTEAINLTSAVTKAYGDTSAGAVEKASDLALLTVRLGQTTFPELASSIGKVAPLTAQLAISQEELATVFATLTGVTGSAAEVSTQFRSALVGLQKPSDEMQAALQRMGFMSGEAALKSLGFKGTLDGLLGTVDGNANALTKLWGQTESWSGIAALAGGQSETFNDKLRQMGGYAGVTTAAMKEHTEGIGKQAFMWDQLKSRVSVYLERAGDRLAPSLMRVTEAVTPLFDRGMQLIEMFSGLPGPVQQAAFAIAGLAIIGGPVLIGVGKFLAVGGDLLQWASSFSGKAAPKTVDGLTNMGKAAGSARFAVLGLQGVIIGLSVVSIAKFAAEAWGLFKDQERHRQQLLEDNKRIAEALSTASRIAGREVKDLGEAALLVDAHNTKMRGGTDRATISLTNFGGVAGKAGVNLKAAASGASDFGAQLPTLADAIDGLRKSQQGLIIDAKAQVAHLLGNKGVGGLSSLTEKQTKNLHDSLQSVVDEYGSLKKAGLGALEPIYQRTNAIVGKGKELREEVAKMSKEFQSLISADPTAVLRDAPGAVPILTDTFKERPAPILDFRTSRTARLPIATGADIFRIPGGMPSFTLGGAPAKKPFAGVGGRFGDFMGSMPGTILGALQGGGSVSGSIGSSLAGFGAKELIGSFSKKFAASGLGKLASGALSSALPVVGGLIAPAITGIFGKLFGGGEKKETKTMVDEFVGQFEGGLTGLQKLAKDAGVSLSALLGAKKKNVAEAEIKKITAAIQKQQEEQDRLNRAVEKYGLTWKDMTASEQIKAITTQAKDLLAEHDLLIAKGYTTTAVTRQMAGATNEWMTNALSAGEKIPAAMQPMIESLIRSGRLTEENARLLLGLGENGAPSIDDVREAADFFGISLEDLGPKINQLRITEEATKAAKAWNTLLAAGGDVNVMLVHAKDKAQDFVTHALKFGTEIPESMRPMLTTMVEHGLLVDDSGEKLRDLSGINFATPLNLMFEALIGKLDQFIDKLGGGVTNAVDRVREHADRHPIVIKGRFDMEKGRFIRDQDDGLTWDWDSEDGKAHTGALVTANGLQKHHRGTARILAGPWGGDEVPALLKVGEAVLNPAATAALGPEAIEALNRDPNSAMAAIDGAARAGGSQMAGGGAFAATDIAQLVRQNAEMVKALRRQPREVARAVTAAMNRRSA